MIDDIFYSNIASIDLHGYDRQMARVMTNDFVYESYVLGRSQIIIIHGIGQGIVKNTVHDTLAKNNLVKSYKIDMFNQGITIVELNVDKH